MNFVFTLCALYLVELGGTCAFLFFSTLYSTAETIIATFQIKYTQKI